MNHLRGNNKFTIQADPERRLAYRAEIKRQLAKYVVTKTRISELRDIIARLQADSEAAADSHQRDAATLQAELKSIDQKHVDAVLAGTELPQKQVERRSQILNEIQTLNRVLDDRCQTNKRAIQPLEREVAELRQALVDETALRNELGKLCSNDLRRRRLFVEHQMRFCDFMAKEAAKNVEVLRGRVEVDQRNKDSQGELIDSLRLEDWKFVSLQCGREMQRLRELDQSLEQEALAE